MNCLQPIEHLNQRVLTTSQLAESYGTEPKRVSSNFTENKERYTEGKHFFRIEGDQLTDLRSRNSGLQIGPMVRVIYLWTEKGAWLHAKSLNTDRAWEAYELLVDEYYRLNLNELQKPMTQAEILLKQAELMVEHDRRLKKVEDDSQRAERKAALAHHRINLMDSVNVNGTPRQQLNEMVKKIARKNGVTFAEAHVEFKQAFNRAFGTNLQRRMNDYQKNHGLKNLTYPDYLERVGQVEDGIRVADKILSLVRRDVPNPSFKNGMKKAD
ncbi:ORF6N domain-containing protein [Heliobacterium chlorum]|uniref:ORF6N domain-containing protein n=1 Tax=Heliobacterium chlorum TaxID=2698 RepID=A0ABR7T6L4_HELCL|nr:ORF6N domain-containing protein [Heliobacterium chlorum]MBC9786392.1 ORF6N domain-containing protein [Heliobacterium chlorum]